MSLSFFIYLVLQLFLNTSHAYQHRHLRRASLYKGRGDVVENASSQESHINQWSIPDIQAQLDAKLALRDSVIELLNFEGSAKEKRWVRHAHNVDHGVGARGLESRSTTLEELQQTLNQLNRTIQALYDILSSSIGAQSRTTTQSATATSTSGPSTFTTDTTSNVSPTMSSSAISSRSSMSSSTTSTAVRYVFDPMSSSNVAVYYGQTDQTANVPLSAVCSDPDVDIIILAFMNRLSTGPAGYPGLNMGVNCWAATSAQVNAGATGLIDCVSDGFADEVKSCQNIGKKMLLSIGGAVGYSETTIDSDGDAARIADNIWNIFGEGGLNDDSVLAIRPFGDFVFDGFDIGKQHHASTMIMPSVCGLSDTRTTRHRF